MIQSAKMSSHRIQLMRIVLLIISSEYYNSDLFCNSIELTLPEVALPKIELLSKQTLSIPSLQKIPQLQYNNENDDNSLNDNIRSDNNIVNPNISVFKTLSTNIPKPPSLIDRPKRPPLPDNPSFTEKLLLNPPIISPIIDLSQLSSAVNSFSQMINSHSFDFNKLFDTTKQILISQISAMCSTSDKWCEPDGPKPVSCNSTDYECQVKLKCWSCYSNHYQPICLPCLKLKQCKSDLTCQTNNICEFCNIALDDKPQVCNQMNCENQLPQPPQLQSQITNTDNKTS